MADRLGAGLPNQLDGLDSRTPLHEFAVFVQWLGRQAASLHTPVRVWYTAPSCRKSCFESVRIHGSNPGFESRRPCGVSSNGRTPAHVSPRKHCRRCAGFVSLGTQLDSGTRLQLFADVVQEEERSFRKREVGISSIPVGPIVVPGKDRWRSAALVRLTGEFKSPAGTHCRKALRASSRLTDRKMVRFHRSPKREICGNQVL